MSYEWGEDMDNFVVFHKYRHSYACKGKGGVVRHPLEETKLPEETKFCASVTIM